MELFRHDAAPAVRLRIIASAPLSNSTPIEGQVSELARLDARLSCDAGLLVEKESCGRRRQKVYTDAFVQLLAMATNQLMNSARHFAQ